MQRMFARRRPAGSFTIFGFIIAVLVLIADQASKYWMLYGLDLDGRTPQQVEVLSPWFNLTMVWNHGVSFGMFQADSDMQRYILAGVSLAIAGLLAFWMFQTTRRLQALAFGLIIGGAIGNVIDRFLYGAVVDFFDFSGLYFPYVFNVADAGICVGVAVMVLDLVLNGDR